MNKKKELIKTFVILYYIFLYTNLPTYNAKKAKGLFLYLLFFLYLSNTCNLFNTTETFKLKKCMTK